MKLNNERLLQLKGEKKKNELKNRKNRLDSLISWTVNKDLIYHTDTIRHIQEVAQLLHWPVDGKQIYNHSKDFISSPK